MSEAQTGVPQVRAGGGVVWRRRPGGAVEVVLVHRPGYDDWSLPKGKLEPGETDEEAALREVEEEIGVRCHLGPELAATAYLDHRQRRKQVRYWAMTPGPGDVDGHHEVDQAVWLPLPEARARLTYARDRDVLDSLARTLGGA